MPSKLDTALGDYLKEIKSFSLLTADEEKELGRKIRLAPESDDKLARGEISLAQRDRIQLEAARARDRMIQANLRLVISVAKNFRNRGLPMEDLVNEGNVGLMNAVDRFDPTLGSRFSTYAGYWIDQAIRRAVQTSQQMIHIPSYLMEQIAHMRLAQRELEEQLGRPPELHEICAKMQITPRKARAIASALRACTLRTQGGANGDGENILSDMVEDTRTPPPHEAAFSQSDADFVSRVLSRITDREALVLKMRFGLSDAKGKRMTLKEIGAAIGLTRERVRQIERDAKQKLEEFVKEYI